MLSPTTTSRTEETTTTSITVCPEKKQHVSFPIFKFYVKFIMQPTDYAFRKKRLIFLAHTVQWQTGHMFLPVEREPGVVEAEPHEGEEEVELLVDLGLGVPHVQLEVAVAVVAALVVERVPGKENTFLKISFVYSFVWGNHIVSKRIKIIFFIIFFFRAYVCWRPLTPKELK